MGAVRLDCPVCGAEFLRTNKASKTCSRECSHKLVKRRPMLGKYRMIKTTPHEKAKVWAEIRAAMARLELHLQ